MGLSLVGRLGNASICCVIALSQRFEAQAADSADSEIARAIACQSEKAHREAVRGIEAVHVRSSNFVGELVVSGELEGWLCGCGEYVSAFDGAANEAPGGHCDLLVTTKSTQVTPDPSRMCAYVSVFRADRCASSFDATLERIGDCLERSRLITL